ncbi:hypothetical protein DSM19430T_15780 [Desulfovibrio psychrotolerans]|uniref:Uncharacterized protein n=1 Tax=Desulfovibrio psychrotolerans TaxID=415242 RepID=A0A7J0BV54_9BACT|nr:hypothetical protein DSM19430T_15780 [Desulfovibrio psychrotolerans]
MPLFGIRGFARTSFPVWLLHIISTINKKLPTNQHKLISPTHSWPNIGTIPYLPQSTYERQPTINYDNI